MQYQPPQMPFPAGPMSHVFCHTRHGTAFAAAAIHQASSRNCVGMDHHGSASPPDRAWSNIDQPAGRAAATQEMAYYEAMKSSTRAMALASGAALTR